MSAPATPRTVAVTGASGLVGRALCRSLASRGYQVRALTRRPDEGLSALDGVTRFACDLPDAIAPESLEGCDVVIHCAYVTRPSSARDAERVNEEGTLRLLARSRQAGVRRFVFMSTTSAHEGARSYYGQSKLRLERALDPERDLVIRPGLVISTEGGLFHRMTGGSRGSRLPWLVPLFDGGAQPLQTIHIDDLCDAVHGALERNVCGTITVAAAERSTMRDFVNAVARHQRRRAIVVPVPTRAALAAFRTAEALRIPLPVSSENLLGLLSLRHWDTEPDLRRLGLTVRSLPESLASLSRGAST